MKLEFPYFTKDGQRFPIIEIGLRHHTNTITLNALIDSGASLSVFRPEVGTYLGINIEQGKKIYLSGIGGRILGYVHTLALTVGSVSFSCKVVFSPEFTVSFNLLGRDNFFKPFIISFLETQKKLILRSA